MTGSMDHMEPSLSSAKVGGGLFLYLKHPLTMKQFFWKKEESLLKMNRSKKFSGWTWLARFISHSRFLFLLDKGTMATNPSFPQRHRTHRQGQCRFHVGGREVAGEIACRNFGAMPNLRKVYPPWKKSEDKRILGHPRFINLTILTALFLQDVSLKRLTPALYEDAGLWHNTWPTIWC